MHTGHIQNKHWLHDLHLCCINSSKQLFPFHMCLGNNTVLTKAEVGRPHLCVPAETGSFGKSIKTGGEFPEQWNRDLVKLLLQEALKCEVQICTNKYNHVFEEEVPAHLLSSKEWDCSKVKFVNAHQECHPMIKTYQWVGINQLEQFPCQTSSAAASELYEAIRAALDKHLCKTIFK